MITVENDRIRVTVTQAVWDSFDDQAELLAHTQTLPSGEQRDHTPEQVRRGLVLSESMKMMENPLLLQYVIANIPNSKQLLLQSKMLLMFEHLNKHGQFNAHDSLYHFQERLAMPTEMERDVMAAEAFADAQLLAFDTENAKTELHRALVDSVTNTDTLMESERCLFEIMLERRNSFLEKIMGVNTATLTKNSAGIISKLATLMLYKSQNEPLYASHHVVKGRWKIELIGELPSSIALSSYTGWGAA